MSKIYKFKDVVCEMYFCRNKETLAKVLQIDFDGREQRKRVDGFDVVIHDVDIILDKSVGLSYLGASDCIDFPSDGTYLPLELLSCTALPDGTYHGVIRTIKAEA